MDVAFVLTYHTQRVDENARKYLGMSGAEFERRLKAGEIDIGDSPAVTRIAMISADNASGVPQELELSDTAKLRGAHPLRLDYRWHPDGESPITWPHLHVGADIRRSVNVAVGR